MATILVFFSELAIWFGTLAMLASFVIGLVLFKAFKLSLSNRLDLMTGGVMLALLPYLLTTERSLTGVTRPDGLLLLFSIVLFLLGIRLLLLSLVTNTP